MFRFPARSQLSCAAGTTSQIARLKRTVDAELGLQLRDVQVAAAQRLCDRCVVQMETGEGKTLALAVAANLLATNGRSVFIATANDYLAARDAAWMGPIYQSLGHRVSVVGPSTPSAGELRSRSEANVTYGTLRQFAFDYLRDQARQRHHPGDLSQFGKLDALMVDEADSLLIDEARTPLVIHAADATVSSSIEACFRWAAQAATEFADTTDFVLTETGSVALTSAGQSKLLRTSMPTSMDRFNMTEIQHALERAILVSHSMRRDQQYIIRDQRIAIVDEYTGRASTNRTFGAGVQQAIEAREGLDLSPPHQPVGRITVQDFAGKFQHLCGMTATAWHDRQELQRVYQLDVIRIPTDQPSRRQLLTPIVCASQSDKLRQITQEVQAVLAQQRAVLIGTRTVEQSEALSKVFELAAIEHVVLNARQDQQEAEIVASAGQSRRVTVATNMAGRGTDIPLSAKVRSAGGLHVIVAEMNLVARIDAQLIGRCGRQGDPGSARIFISADDELIQQAFGARVAQRLQRRSDARIIRCAGKAQHRIQQQHRRERSQLTAYEDQRTASLRLLGLNPYLDVPCEPLS